MANILTLWDIDGNMVNVYKFHTPAYQAAIKDEFGVDLSFDEIESNYGEPANEVVAIPLRNAGVDEERIQEGLEDVLVQYAQQLEQNIREGIGEERVVLPGVEDVLDYLSENNVPMGVVTGNIRLAGEAILKATGLMPYFNEEINAFGDGVSERQDIVSRALDGARDVGVLDDSTVVYVFGDTPTDVVAARKKGCTSVAVVKNSWSDESSPGGEVYEERKRLLEGVGPDYLFDDYTDLTRIKQILDM